MTSDSQGLQIPQSVPGPYRESDWCGLKGLPFLNKYIVFPGIFEFAGVRTTLSMSQASDLLSLMGGGFCLTEKF